MGVVDAPQWLLPAFVRSAKAVGASADDQQLRAAGERLVSMWTSPDRCFHNLKHAIDMLARVDELADESHNPDVMRLAVWYHGCIFSSAHEETYRRNGGEDEVASAAYAAEDLQSLGVPDKVTDRICALILNLKRHNLPADDIDAMALNDADLGALAVEPQQYKRYREQVHAEYAHIPLAHYLRARLTIVSKLLDRDVLFHSPLGERWELPARQNLEAELRRLTDELSQLGSEVSESDAGACDAPGAAPAAVAGQDTAAGGGAGVASPAESAGLARPTGPLTGSIPAVPTGMSPAAASALSAPSVTGSFAAVPPVASATPLSAYSASTATGGVPVAAHAASPASAGAGAAGPAQPGSAPVARVSIIPGRQGAGAASPATASVPAVPAVASTPVTATPAAPVSPATAPQRPVETVRAAGEPAPRSETDSLAHTTTMESCAEDIDRLLATPRTITAPGGMPVASAPVAGTGEVPVVDRKSIVEAERAKLAERARIRAEEAKVAREARTGEFQAITAPILEEPGA